MKRLLGLTLLLFCSCVLSAQTFIPSDLPGLKLWLASDTGITESGSLISGWADISGNNNNAVLISGVNAPLLTPSALNGFSSIKFSGNEGLQVPNVNLGNKGSSVFAVSKLNSKTPYGMFLAYGINTSGTWNFRQVENTGRVSLVNAQTNIGAGATGAVSPAGTTLDLEGENFRILNGEMDNNSDTWNLYENGNLKDTRSEPFDQSVTESVFIGLRGDNLGFLNGELLEIIIFDSTLTSIDRIKVEQYLKDKYTAPVALGSDKNACSFPITIHAKKDYFTDYLWQGGSSADSLVIDSAGTYYLMATDVFESISYDTITIIQDSSAYTVNLGNDTTICSGQQIILDAGPSHLSYIWFDGSDSNSFTALTTGVYWVSVTDCQSNISKDTISITVNPLPVFSLGSDTTTCFNSNFFLKPDLANLPAYTFLWSGGSTDSTLFVDQSGQYTLNVSDAIGCSFADTINISIDSTLIQVSLGSDASLCSGNSIFLQTGASLATSYLWSDSSSNDSLQITVASAYWVVITNINGCTVSDTINVSIAGNAPIASFIATDACFGSATVFNDLSSVAVIAVITDTITSWDWDFGDSGISVIQNPSHTYADTGSFTVSLKVTTNAGCSEQINKVVRVYPFPLIGFTTSANLCEDIGVSFTANDTTFGYPISAWSWNFGDPSSGANNTSIVQNTGHYYAGSGIYPVTFIAFNTYGCADTLISNITIKQGPVANFISTLACHTAPVQFTDNSILPTSTTLNSSFWNFGDATANSALLNPSHNYSNSITYNVMHIVTASNGCKDTVILPVTINPKPIAAFSPEDGCVNSPVMFNDLSTISGGSINAWAWTFDATGTSALQDPQYSFTLAGTPSIKLIVTSDKGCKDTVIQAVTIHPNPVAAFTQNPNYGSPPLAVSFTNTTADLADFTWNFGDGSDLSQLINPFHTFADTGSFRVSLIAVNSFGCSDTAFYTLDVAERLIDVEVAAFSTSVTNNFLNINAEFKNHGTSDVHMMDVFVKINDGSFVKVFWGGLLLRNGSVNYSFTTSLYIDDAEHYVCISAQNPDGYDDEVPENNELCNSIDVGKFQVFAPYPNPAHDLIALPLFVPGSKELSVLAYSASGEKAAVVFEGTIDEGFHSISFNTVNLAAGLYVFKITYDDETVIQKFIKN